MCAAIGLLAFHGLGPHAWAEAAGVGACIAAMLGFRLVHPPAGSNPLIIFALKADWSYLFFPALFGSIGLVTLAWLWRKVSREGPGRPADS